MSESIFPRYRGICVAGLVLTLTAACSNLLPTPIAPPNFYTLDAPLFKAPAASLSGRLPSLSVTPPLAASGFDSQHIIYRRTAHQLDYFAHSEWVDTPARMLAPLIVAALERRGGFQAVVSTPSSAASELRLDSRILRLQHDFSVQPSRVRFTLRADLVDNATRQVIAGREFDATVVAASDDAYGGVVAANGAVQAVLAELADFCSVGAAAWRQSPENTRLPGK